jgi:hypothetical protein
MTKPYDPIAAQRAMLYSRAELESIFKGSGVTAQKLCLENEELYHTMRKEAVAQGILGPSAKGTPAPYTTGKPQRNFSDRELFLRAKYTAQECREFFNAPAGSKNNPTTLFQTNPEGYREIKEAAISHGILPATPSTYSTSPQTRTTTPEPQPGSGETFELDPKICQELNLPAGYRVNQLGFRRVMETLRNASASRTFDAQKAEQAAKDAAANKPTNEGA